MNGFIYPFIVKLFISILCINIQKRLDKADGAVHVTIVKKGTLTLVDAGCDMNHCFLR